MYSFWNKQHERGQTSVFIYCMLIQRTGTDHSCGGNTWHASPSSPPPPFHSLPLAHRFSLSSLSSHSILRLCSLSSSQQLVHPRLLLLENSERREEGGLVGGVDRPTPLPQVAVYLTICLLSLTNTQPLGTHPHLSRAAPLSTPVCLWYVRGTVCLSAWLLVFTLKAYTVQQSRKISGIQEKGEEKSVLKAWGRSHAFAHV